MVKVYSVTKIKDRVTEKIFYTFDDALKYYDNSCMRKPVTPYITLEEVELAEGARPKKTQVYYSFNPKHYWAIYRNSPPEGTYRNVRAEKKKEKGMHPFGL